jgi:hypothetical protein
MSMICKLASVPDREAQVVLSDPSALYELLEALEGSESVLSLESSWHGLHFILTGTAGEGEPPQNFLVAGGEAVEDEDVGYGPARVFDAGMVLDLDTALGMISDEEFARRFDPARLAAAEIYPQIWDEPRQDLLEGYGYCFRELKAHVHRASQTGQALIVTIT